MLPPGETPQRTHTSPQRTHRHPRRDLLRTTAYKGIEDVVAQLYALFCGNTHEDNGDTNGDDFRQSKPVTEITTHVHTTQRFNALFARLRGTP